jgi:A/G-specific adenine glycosylase
VLLQQTRVAQAAPYYERFIRRFPTVGDLAAAPLESVLKAWQGAGYYARARHLHDAAREVVAHHSGRLPTTVTDLEGLPGIGPYVARAIASLAFGSQVVALEANGLRVAARWTREEGDIRRAAVRARLGAEIGRTLPAGSASEFNEALMELGETVCRPVAPDCAACPVSRFCRARRETDDPGALPRRPIRPRRPHVKAALVVLTDDDRWFVQQRPPAGLLGGLWEFPGGKVERDEGTADAARRELREETGLRARSLAARGVVRHAYSHFTLELHVYEGALDRRSRSSRPVGRWVTRSELLRLPIPKATEKVVRLLDRGPMGTASPG